MLTYQSSWDATCDETRRALRRQLTRSLINDRDQRWIGKFREMTVAIRNSHYISPLISNIGPQKTK